MGLSTIGIVHTTFAVVAVACALLALARRGAISRRDPVGRVYVATTVVTCLTAFFIFRHGAFGVPHALAVLTLLALAVAALAEQQRFGAWSQYLATTGYSATLFFHSIPGVVETTTRLPADDPLFASDQAPALQLVLAGLFALFLLGTGYQLVQLRRRPVMSLDRFAD